MTDSEYYLKGPEHCSEPENSIGWILFESLKNSNHKDVAIIDGISNEQYTFEDILKLSIKCAISMKNRGIKKNDVISILSENNLNYSIPIIAAWYIGAVVNPMSPLYTPVEMEHLLEITAPKAVFASNASLHAAKELQCKNACIEHVIGLDTENFKDFLSNVKDDATASFVPDSFDYKTQNACILMSSGTSGMPKGVMLTHENVRYTFHSLSDSNMAALKAGDCTVCAIPYFHIFGMYLLINSIKLYSKLISMAKFIPDLWLGNIQKYKVNKLFIVPSLGVFLAKSPLVQKYDLSSVQDVLSGAAPLSKDTETALKELLHVKSVRQLYGATEASGSITMVPPGTHDKYGSSGKLVTGLTAKIVDVDTGKPVKRNQQGEVRVKGPSIMKGYCKNPEETVKTFDEEGFLKTGDAGYFDEDGFLYIVDRLKELIKYKGFQVPPAEIEGILLRHPGVKEAAVVGKTDERSGELATAFIVPFSKETLPSEQELIDLVAKELSLHKHLHGGVKFVDELPKNGTGKLLRRELRNIINCH